MFKYFNPNPKWDGKTRGWKQVDCTVRSICAATDLTWIQVYKLLTKAGLEEYTMPHDIVSYSKVLKNLGFKSIKKCKKGEFTVRDICNLSKKNNSIYVCKCINHVVCCKNGQILDTYDSSHKEVLQYWIKDG